MLKIIHTGGINISKEFANLNKSLREEYKTVMQQAFFRLIKFAKEKCVDAIFISGDLYSTNYPDYKDVKFIQDTISNVQNIKIFVIGGENDSLAIERMYLSDDCPKNLYLLNNEKYKFKIKEGCDIFYIDNSYINNKEKLAEKIRRHMDPNNINILGIYKKELNESDIASFDLGFDYIALGGETNYKCLSNIGNTVMSAYSGALVGTDFKGCESDKGFIYMNIDKKHSNFEFVKLDINMFKRLEVDVTGFIGTDEIINHIKSLMNEECAYEILLKGELNPELYIEESKLLDLLKEDNRITNIEDEMQITYQKGQCMKKGKDIFINNLVDKMYEQSYESKMIYKKALKYGLNAMESRV